MKPASSVRDLFSSGAFPTRVENPVNQAFFSSASFTLFTEAKLIQGLVRDYKLFLLVWLHREEVTGCVTVFS